MVRDFSSIFTIMLNGDNEYKAGFEGITLKKMRGIEKWQLENLYFFNSKGDNLRLSQFRTSLVMSDDKMQ